MLALEERIKRIEDQLGITEKDARKQELASLLAVYLTYGFPSGRAKGMAWRAQQDGLSPSQVEGSLLRRGAVLVTKSC